MGRRITKYPWFWTGIVAILVYSDLRALHGGWVYDDAGSVIKNVVVNGAVPWREAFKRDYWGTDMKEAQSHKSFRPITTLTLRANWLLGKYLEGELSEEEKQKSQAAKQNLPPTWNFHATNIVLHGIVTGLVTRATSFVLPKDDVVSQLVVGTLFAVHPVHAEAVSNITSRGELLMSVFFVAAFLVFAGTLERCQSEARRKQIKMQLQPAFLRNNNPNGNGNGNDEDELPAWQKVCGIYLLPWLCMTLSLFSKEQGATALIAAVAWDFVKHHGNLVELHRKLFVAVEQQEQKIATSSTEASEGAKKKDDDDNNNNNNDDNSDDDDDLAAALADLVGAKRERSEAREFVVRTLFLAVETLLVVAWRQAINGESSPDFIEAQNPAGFAKDRFTRAFSVTWVYCLYIRDALYPYYLSPDWSGRSIDLITSLKDPRAMVVLALWYFSAQSFWTMVVGAETSFSSSSNKSKNGKKSKKSKSNDPLAWNRLWNETTLRQTNIAVWAFTFSPFLLSSNILIVVGLMKADRVIYLPLFGFCLLEALLIGKCLGGAVRMRPALERRREQLFWGAHFLFLFQVIVFSGRTHERNLAWSDSLRLWGSAYAVNPRSYHTMYNYGYELSLKQRYAESEAVMRPVGSARVDGPSNTFVYTMVLFNLKRCDLANELLDEAFEVIAEKRAEGGTRNTDSSLSRSESNLLVAKAHCTDDPQERGRVLYKSVETDPTNDYAVNLATSYMQQLQQI